VPFVRVGDCDVAAETSSSTKNAFASPKSRNKEKWLYGIYRMGRDSIDKGKNEPPYAFIIPADQSDPNTAVKLVNTLRAGAVEAWRAASPFWSEGTQYPAGSYVFLASQPFRPYLVEV